MPRGALGYAPIDPIQMLVWSAVLNGIVPVPIMTVMMVVVTRPSVIGRFSARPTLIIWVGWRGADGCYRCGTDLVLNWLTRTFVPNKCVYSSGTIRSNVPYLLRGSNDLRRRMNILPVDRALIIYGALADRSETRGARERLFQHLMKMYIEGEKDEHRLTVEGLSYLHNLNREIDSRN
jgi:hypothetical protein